MKFCLKIYIFLQVCRLALSAWPMRARFAKPTCVPRISMMYWLMPGSVTLMRSYTTWPIQVLTTRKAQRIIVGDVRNGVCPQNKSLAKLLKRALPANTPEERSDEFAERTQLFLSLFLLILGLFANFVSKR